MSDEEPKMKVVIPFEMYQKLIAYVDVCDTEITGFFDVEYVKEKNIFLVTKVYDLLEQEAGGADVQMDEESVSAFNLELIKQGVEQLPRGWWHSHVNMDAFLSGTDEATLEYLENDSFIVALVANKKHIMKAKVRVFNPYKFEIENVPVEIRLADNDLEEEARKEIEKKVKTRFVQGWNNKDWKGKQQDFGDSDTNGSELFSHNGVRKWLPKDKNKALDRIVELTLLREWDRDLHDFVYIDPANDDIWIDNGASILLAEYEEARGIKDFGEDDEPKGKKKRAKWKN